MNKPDEPAAEDDQPRDESAAPQPAEESLVADEMAAPAPSNDNETEAADALQAENDLPEWEPLTPELVEDEAIRGDFMLRWAVILLALLMGWTVIQNTAVLTHIKSGEAIAANGYLPPRTDPLSSTAKHVAWVNLAWLWDLTAAGVHGALGDGGISLLKALLAALTFWMLARISRPDVSTWWGSVCGILALIAAFPSLTATPAIVTLLGVVVLLSLLPLGHRASSSRGWWLIVLTLALWNQFDDRAWIGLAVLLVFVAGRWWDSRQASEVSTEPMLPLGRLAIVSAVAMLVHPFLWETLLSPVKLYLVDYPALQIYANRDVSFLYERFPAWSKEYWQISYFNGAGLLLWGVTLVTLVLNAARMQAAHLALFAVSTVLMVCGGGEMAVAAMIQAALATLNAQEWYQASFRQTYSVEPAELLFSQGGRALTVMAFFAVGFAMVSGHLTGADGRRVGMGFDKSLQQEIASYSAVLADSYDDRPFNFRLEQGDVLNWVGQEPFIDSRVRLFAAGSPSIMDEHLPAREALRLPRDATGDQQQREVWSAIFDHYEITHVLPRLSGGVPDYRTFDDLMSSSDWTLTSLGAATAAFYRTDETDPALVAFIAEHRQPGFLETVLRSRDPQTLVTGQRLTWPQPPSVYERYVYLPRPTHANALQLARHDLSLAENQRESTGEIVALLYATIRHTHDGLTSSPNDRTAYHALGQAYGMLWDLERNVMQQSGLVYPASLRYLQTIAAYQHALACDPADALAHYQLFRIYASQQRQDLAEHHLQRFQKLTGRLTLLSESDANFIAAQQQMAELLAGMSTAVQETQTKMQEDVAAGADRLLIAQRLSQTGFPLLALETLETDLTVVSGNPLAAHLYGRLLLEAGRTSEAYDQLQGVKRLAEQQPQAGDWPADVAAGEVVAEDLRAALSTLADEHRRLSTSSAALLLQVGPLTPSGLAAGPDAGANPLLPVAEQLQVVSVYYDQLLPRLEANSMRQALIELELGENGAASDRFRGILEQNPISSLRPIAETYLRLLSADPDIPPLPDAEAQTSTVEDLPPKEPSVESNATTTDGEGSPAAESKSEK